MIGTGLILGGAVDQRNKRQQLAIEQGRNDLEAKRLGLEQETAARGAITNAIKATRDEIDNLITVAREAKAKGATPEQLAPLRRQIEVIGGQMGIPMPGLPTPKGGAPVPGGESVVQMGLNRFDAIVGATPSPKVEDTPAFPGTGMDAAAANVASAIAKKAETGAPITSADRRAYALAFGKLTEPRIVGTPESGYRIVQPELDAALFPAPSSLGIPRPPPAAGTSPAASAPADAQPAATPTPTAPAGGSGGNAPAAPTATARTPTAAGGSSPPVAVPSTTAAAAGTPSATPGFTVSPLTSAGGKSANEAGRIAVITQGLQTARAVRDAIIQPDGSVDGGTLFQMFGGVPIPGVGTFPAGGIPGTPGRVTRAQLEDAISNKIRIETGASQTKEETASMLDRFAPSIFDPPEAIKDKLNRLVQFFEQSITIADPEMAKKLLDRAEAEGTVPKPPADEPGAKFKGFSREGYPTFQRPDGSYFGVLPGAQ